MGFHGNLNIEVADEGFAVGFLLEKEVVAMTCPVCGKEMVALMLDVGYAKWFCLDCENRRVIEAEGCE